MTDIERVIYDIERCICHIPDACKDCSRYGHDGDLRCMEALMSDAMELLKGQDAEIGQLRLELDIAAKKLTNYERLLEEMLSYQQQSYVNLEQRRVIQALHYKIFKEGGDVP